jgi:hypothetical protein
MKPEKQRIAIAEYCGWKNCRIESLAGQNQMLGKCPFDFTDSVGFAVPPDYLNSLDAMHEAEKSFRANPELWEIYFDHLKIISDDSNDPITATAAQRAEAFLRTVGRWEG